MTNPLSRFSKPSVSRNQPNSRHDIERALSSADDARDIAKDFLRRLPDYEGSEEESTARHEVPSIHVHMHSEHDGDAVEAPVIKGWPMLSKILVAAGALLLAAVATYIAGKLGK